MAFSEYLNFNHPKWKQSKWKFSTFCGLPGTTSYPYLPLRTIDPPDTRGCFLSQELYFFMVFTYSLPGTILLFGLYLFSPRNYTSQKIIGDWRICCILSWPRNYTSHKGTKEYAIMVNVDPN